ATEFCVPKSLKEQAEIGQYFTNLDNLITLHQRKPFQRKMEVKFYVRRC
ncbi:MAG: restriction endonuclease subunit S, partial [Ruminococcus sp.]|nr:restriction endonuclease subunit S [Ruminococcus sp.]